MSPDSFIKNNLWLQDCNFFYGKIEIFDFKKTPFKYVFSVAIIMYSCETVWVNVLVSKGWLWSEITVQTLYGKKQIGERGGRVIWGEPIQC